MKKMALSAAQKYLTKIPQYTRNALHLRAVLQHGTPRKWANLAMVDKILNASRAR